MDIEALVKAFVAVVLLSIVGVGLWFFMTCVPHGEIIALGVLSFLSVFYMFYKAFEY